MGSRPGTNGGLRVLRVCSVFEPPAGEAGRDARFDPIGGMQNHTGQLTRELDRMGLRQDVVTAWRPSARAVERLGRSARVLRLGVPTPRLRQLWAPAAARVLPRLARAADLVHVHLGEDLAVVPLGMRAAAAARVPAVLTIHTSLRTTLRPGDARGVLLRALGGPIESWGVRRAAAVIALASPTARRLLDDGIPADLVHVIPSGVDPARFACRPPDPHPRLGRPRVLFLGRVTGQKGVLTLVRAVALMRSGAPVVIAGDGPLRPRAEALARRLAVSDRVRFVGFVPPSDVPAQLLHADVLVVPSAYEELGSVMLEALAAGLPIVASAVGGIPDVVEDGVNGRLVPPARPEVLAAALDGLLGDAALRRGMGEASRARAEDFHWDRLTERVLAVYRAVLDGRDRAPAGPASGRVCPGAGP